MTAPRRDTEAGGDLPSVEQVQYAAARLRARQAKAMEALVTDEAIEEVAQLVASYVDSEYEPTAHDVACQILRGLACKILEPLLPEGPRVHFAKGHR